MNLNSLLPGGYNFTIVVNNTLGMTATDTVMVTVLEPGGVLDPLIVNLSLFITIGSIGVIVVIVILIIRAKSTSEVQVDFSFG